MTDAEDARAERADWEARYAERGNELDRAPSSWVVDRCLTLPPRGIVLDVAGGTGRHAAALAERGRRVIVVDFVHRAVEVAATRHALISGLVADAAALPLRAESVDAIVCVSFLHRSLFNVFTRLLRPGGALVYETFTRAHLDVVARGRARGPRNPAYLLEPAELPTLVSPLRVQEHTEGLIVDGAGERHVARVMAVKE